MKEIQIQRKENPAGRFPIFLIATPPEGRPFDVRWRFAMTYRSVTYNRT